MRFFISILLCLFSPFFGSCQIPEHSSLVISPQPIDAEIKGYVLDGPSVLSDPERFVWGGSVVKGDDGKFHMLYATWECGDTIPPFNQSWVLHSKIAYAVSDEPDRNFKFQKIVLRGRALDGDSTAWDAQMVHNPHIKKFNGKYYLYYIGSKDPGKQPAGSYGEKLSKRDRVQQNQCIGVIEFNNFEELVEGKFNRPLDPILRPRTRVKKDNVVNPSPKGTLTKPDNLIVVNPSVVYRPEDNKYLLIFKGNIYVPEWRGVHGVAIGETPMGPFLAKDQYIFDIKMEDGRLASAEDPYVWYHKSHQRFYAVFKDFSGKFTNGIQGLAIMESDNGENWKQTENPLFMKKQVILSTGDTLKVDRLERPQLLIDDQGNPEVLYLACSIESPNNKKDGSTVNVHIPLQSKK